MLLVVLSCLSGVLRLSSLSWFSSNRSPGSLFQTAVVEWNPQVGQLWNGTLRWAPYPNCIPHLAHQAALGARGLSERGFLIGCEPLSSADGTKQVSIWRGLVWWYDSKGRRPRNRALSVQVSLSYARVIRSASVWFCFYVVLRCGLLFWAILLPSYLSLLPRTSSPRGARALGDLETHGDKRRRPQKPSTLFVSFSGIPYLQPASTQYCFFPSVDLSSFVPVFSFVSSSERLSLESFLNHPGSGVLRLSTQWSMTQSWCTWRTEARIRYPSFGPPSF